MFAQNLRNRVAYTAFYGTESDVGNMTPTQATASYFSYDILGNVDTLVQDYHSGIMNSTNNRFKKIVYDYDLQSGKVDKVAYQHGYADDFYHSYLYDAENRITNVLTSADSINWDNDAFYSYYLHGPLSRTVIGDQQVQGINYGYTLQGLMKSVNPPIYTGSGYTLQADGASGSQVATNAYNLQLNYFDGDFAPISDNTMPAANSSTLSSGYRPLYNGNISSMGVSIGALGHPLLYDYQYDQLNRLIHMDSYRTTDSLWTSPSILQDFQENVAYDPNGNILKYKRNGNNTFAGQPIGMDSLTYFYTAGTNKLDHIVDSVPSTNYTTDLDSQGVGNYGYDAIGELTKDSTNGISNVTWTVYGKINTITKSDGSSISFTYDPAGNRISKTYDSAGGPTIITWYVRDAQGNILSIYTSGNPSINSGDLTRTEADLYGSSRLGLKKDTVDMANLAPQPKAALTLLDSADILTFIRGKKLFELNNHLGNVLATITDKKLGVSLNNTTVDHFSSQVVTTNDYYPFGSLEPGRTYAKVAIGNYRYGFGGQEKDDEVKGSGTSYSAEFWEYDPRVGRRWNEDPVALGNSSPYTSLADNPILFSDPIGLDTVKNAGKAKVGDVFVHQHGNSNFYWDKTGKGKKGFEGGGESGNLEDIVIIGTAKPKKNYGNFMYWPKSDGVDQNYWNYVLQQNIQRIKDNKPLLVGPETPAFYRNYAQAQHDADILDYGAIGMLALPLTLTFAADVGAMPYLVQGTKWLLRPRIGFHGSAAAADLTIQAIQHKGNLLKINYYSVAGNAVFGNPIYSGFITTYTDPNSSGGNFFLNWGINTGANALGNSPGLLLESQGVKMGYLTGGAIDFRAGYVSTVMGMGIAKTIEANQNGNK
jgi:YD repeat-containing protein